MENRGHLQNELLHALPYGVALIMTDGTIVQANRPFLEQFPEDLQTRTNIFHMVNQSPITMELSRRMEQGLPWTYEMPTIRIHAIPNGDVYILSIEPLPLDTRVTVQHNAFEAMMHTELDMAMVMTDANLLINRFNKGATELFGYEPHEVLYEMTPFGLFESRELSEKRTHYQDETERLLSFEQMLRVALDRGDREWKFQRKDRTHFVGKLFMHPVYEQARVIGFFFFVFDVSPEIALKGELLHKEQRYRMFAESVIEAVLFHEGGTILDANKAAESIFRIPAEQMVGRQTIEFIAEGYRADVLRRIRNHIQTPYEVIGRREDGTFLEMEVYPKEVTFQGQTLRVAVMRDISDRKKVERMLEREKNAIARQRDIIQSILQASNEAFVLTESNGSVLFMNVHARRLLDLPGIAPNKMQERIPLLSTFRTRDRTEMLKKIDLLLDGSAREVSMRFSIPQPNDRDEQYYEMYGTGMDTKRQIGMDSGFLFVFRNRTEEERMDQIKNELVSTVSHELRTPLSSLSGYIELMLTRDLNPEKRERYLKTMAKEAKRLTDLLNDFLDIQRMEDGNQEYKKDHFLLNELVRDVVERFRETSNHSIHFDDADEVLHLVADQDRIEQVIINLLSNAIKYSPNHHEIEVRVRKERNQAHVSIQDFGIGIPEHAFEELFKKFYRVDNSDTRQIGGTGLGLSICKEIIESHGGSIEVESSVGVGSTFTFTLDLAEETL
ncbi:ATP-binding protein [Exiguobacterium sp. s56]|uniref:PAS domain-containing sensor histidine kinase n=1 Tax=Exiguobacterium sp. s56 TaxID=2751232 RepID=UPI001BE509C2|nr:ATP-binding protein [Exiguobacterium sp. s56]